jgi:hypothetical protein
MPKITPTQITSPLVRFAEVSGKSERQARKDPAEAKYKSVAGDGRHTIPIDSEIATGIVELAVHMPRKITSNQRPGVLRVQDPGRDRAQTDAATQV